MDGKLRNGKRVIGLEYRPRNSNGKIVTFPIKGTIIIREKTKNKPERIEYAIWTVNGDHTVVGYGDTNPWDLIVPDGLIANPPIATDDEVIYFALTHLYNDCDGKMRKIIKRSGFDVTRVAELVKQYS